MFPSPSLQKCRGLMLLYRKPAALHYCPLLDSEPIGVELY
jgi:hypothetical protein